MDRWIFRVCWMEGVRLFGGCKAIFTHDLTTKADRPDSDTSYYLPTCLPTYISATIRGYG